MEGRHPPRFRKLRSGFLARADPFKENFPCFCSSSPPCHWRASSSGLWLGDRYVRGFQALSVLSTPTPEWGCSYYCSSRAAQGLWLFAALCPQAARSFTLSGQQATAVWMKGTVHTYSDWNALSVTRRCGDQLISTSQSVGGWWVPGVNLTGFLPGTGFFWTQLSQDSLGGSVQTQCSRMPEHRLLPFLVKAPASGTQPHPILSSRTIHHLGTS